MSEIFSINHNGFKVGEVHDRNPIIINTEEECIKIFNDLKETLTLKEKEKQLIDKCIAVVNANNGENVQYGPDEIIALAALSFSHPEKSYEIMACSHFLTETVEFEGEFPADACISAANSYRELSVMMSNALQLADQNINYDDIEDDSDSPESDDSDESYE